MVEREPAWYKRRSYTHFDRPIGPRTAWKLVTDPCKVARHAFLPFLRYEIRSRRYEEEEGRLGYKKREVMYASHRDAHVFAYYAHLLAQAYEAELERRDIGSAPIAYRKLGGKCNIDFAKEAFDAASGRSDALVIAADVSDFFGSMDHAKLKHRWAALLGVHRLPPDHYAVFRAVTRYAYVRLDALPQALGLSKSQVQKCRRRYCSIQEFRDTIRGGGFIKAHKQPRGIPQGSPISAVLSNVYMVDFDTALMEEAEKRGAFYRRYSDDILIVCEPSDGKHFRTLINTQLEAMALSENAKKEQLSRFHTRRDGTREVRSKVKGIGWRRGKPLQYLGFEFDGRRRLLRSATIARQKQRTKRTVLAAYRSARRTGSPRIFRKKIYSLHSHLSNQSSPRGQDGRRRGNFYSYVRRSAERMNDDTPRRQVRSHWNWLQKLIAEQDQKLQKRRGRGRKR